MSVHVFNPGIHVDKEQRFCPACKERNVRYRSPTERQIMIHVKPTAATAECDDCGWYGIWEICKI